MQLEHNERQLSANTLLRLELYAGYDFNTAPGTVSWQVCNYIVYMATDEVTGLPVLDQHGDQAYTISKPVTSSGTMELPMALVANWGSDDEPIFAHVVANL